MVKLDKKDFQILQLLKENAKLTTSKISKKTAIPITTVHNRIKKLQKEGIIKNYTVKVDNKKLGNLISAYILINVDYSTIKKLNLTQLDLADKIKKHPNVQEADVITGQKDMIVKVNVKDMLELNKFISESLQIIPGIKQTETVVVME
ncbi:Lrp/AsnC family transcriptional regulator [Candidatus Pacearchaeota archaeon]|nr:Lrp/AsnC family transcriptional regulator [Candidatus Pacearchaeota archaeon]